jgi:TPR repeat protein
VITGEALAAEPIETVRAAAEAGDAVTQQEQGARYCCGDGTVQNMTEAVKRLRKSAEQGDTEAQRELGVWYEHGIEVEQDMAEDAKWYRKAAEQGDAASSVFLRRIKEAKSE